MILWEGTIEGDVGVHPRDMEWKGMAEEMVRLQTINRGETCVRDDFLMLRDGTQDEDSEGDYETKAGTGAEAGVGAQVGQGRQVLGQFMENSKGVDEAEEANEGIGEGRNGESAAQHERGLLLLRQSLGTTEETMVTGEEGWDMGGRQGLWGMPTVGGTV